MNKKELQDFVFEDSLNNRSWTLIVNDLVATPGHLAAYGLISIVGPSAKLFMRGINRFDDSTVMKLRAIGYEVYGKTGVTTRTIKKRIGQVVGGITLGNVTSSALTERVYDHLCDNEDHEAFHIGVGFGILPGSLEIDQLSIEKIVADQLLKPLNVTLLNDQDQRRNRSPRNHKRQFVEQYLHIETPEFRAS